MTLNAFVVCCGLLAFPWETVIAECPDHHHIDIKWNKTHYIGAYRYDGQASPNAIQSCKGTVIKREEGSEQSAPNGRVFVAHAWVVRPGCVVYEFSDYNFNGSVTEFPAGVHPHVPAGTKSDKVKCSIAHIQCKPIDKFEAVLTCDATFAVAATECNYLKTVGTTFSDSVSHSLSLGASVEAEMTGSFFSLFGAELRKSISTGYNWNSVSEIAKASTKSFQVMASAPPGYILKIEQAIGRCGQSVVKTELFRISHYAKKMKVYKNTTEIVNPK